MKLLKKISEAMKIMLQQSFKNVRRKIQSKGINDDVQYNVCVSSVAMEDDFLHPDNHFQNRMDIVISAFSHDKTKFHDLKYEVFAYFFAVSSYYRFLLFISKASMFLLSFQ